MDGRSTWSDDAITQSIPIEGSPDVFSLRAENVRRERTGVHARLLISLNGTVLSHSALNLERDDDRRRLIVSAYKQIEESLQQRYPQAVLRHDLDIFCLGIWPQLMAQLAACPLAGDADPSPPRFLLEPYILDAGGTFLFAPPESVKSWTALVMAVSLDAGVSTIWPVTPTPCLFLNLERSEASIARRLGGVNAALGLPRRRSLLTLNARGRSLGDVASAVNTSIREHDIGCVVLDSVSRAGHGDLTLDQTANRIVDTLNRLGVGWLAIAHTPRADASHIYGSVHFEAGADLLVQVKTERADDGTIGVGLHVTKANDFAWPPLQVLAYEFDANGLTGVRSARPGEFVDIELSQSRSRRAQIREHLWCLNIPSAWHRATHRALIAGRLRLIREPRRGCHDDVLCCLRCGTPPNPCAVSTLPPHLLTPRGRGAGRAGAGTRPGGDGRRAAGDQRPAPLPVGGRGAGRAAGRELPHGVPVALHAVPPPACTPPLWAR